MFGWGPGEMILILLLVLVVFGAGKLPEVGSALGKGLRSFKDAVNGESDEEHGKPAIPVEAKPSEESAPAAKQDESKKNQ